MNTVSHNESDNLKCLVYNSQSICNKCELVMEQHVIDYDTDVLYLSENWLESKKNNVTAKFQEYGNELFHNILQNRAK